MIHDSCLTSILGYVLSKESVKILVEKGLDDETKVYWDTNKPEDVVMSNKI